MTTEQFLSEVGEVLEYLDQFWINGEKGMTNDNWTRQMHESMSQIRSLYLQTDGAEPDHSTIEPPPCPSCEG